MERAKAEIPDRSWPKIEIPSDMGSGSPQEDPRWIIDDGQYVLQFVSQYHFCVLNDVAREHQAGRPTPLGYLAHYCQVHRPPERGRRRVTTEKSLRNFWRSLSSSYDGKYFHVLTSTGRAVAPHEAKVLLARVFAPAERRSGEVVFGLAVPPDRVTFLPHRPASPRTLLDGYIARVKDHPLSSPPAFFVWPSIVDYENRTTDRRAECDALDGCDAIGCGLPLAGGVEQFRVATRLVLLGEAGAGKSHLLRHLLWQLLDSVAEDGSRGEVPLLIELAAASGQPEDMLAHSLVKSFGKDPRQILGRRRLVVMFDGIDKMGASQNLGPFVANALALTDADESVARVMLTCRPGCWQRSWIAGQDTKVLAIHPFGVGPKEQVWQYLRARFASYPAHLYESLAKPPLDILAQCPQALALMCDTAEKAGFPDRGLPGGKARIVCRWIETKIREMEHSDRHWYDAGKDALVALAMLLTERADTGVNCTEPIHVDTPGLPTSAASHFSLAMRAGLLSSDGSVLSSAPLAFTNEAIRDYFSALRIREDVLRLGLTAVGQRIANVRWHESLLMATEMVDDRVKMKVLDALCLSDCDLAVQAFNRCDLRTRSKTYDSMVSSLTRTPGSIDRVDPAGFAGLLAIDHGAVEKAIQDVWERFVEQATWVISSSLRAPSTMEVARRFMQSPSAVVRTEATKLALSVGSHLLDRGHVRELCLAGATPSIQVAAIAALARHMEDISELTRLLQDIAGNDTSEVVRYAALRELLRLGTEDMAKTVKNSLLTSILPPPSQQEPTQTARTQSHGNVPSPCLALIGKAIAETGGTAREMLLDMFLDPELPEPIRVTAGSAVLDVRWLSRQSPNKRRLQKALKHADADIVAVACLIFGMAYPQNAEKILLPLYSDDVGAPVVTKAIARAFYLADSVRTADVLLDHALHGECEAARTLALWRSGGRWVPSGEQITKAWDIVHESPQVSGPWRLFMFRILSGHISDRAFVSSIEDSLSESFEAEGEIALTFAGAIVSQDVLRAWIRCRLESESQVSRRDALLRTWCPLAGVEDIVAYEDILSRHAGDICFAGGQQFALTHGRIETVRVLASCLKCAVVGSEVYADASFVLGRLISEMNEGIQEAAISAAGGVLGREVNFTLAVFGDGIKRRYAVDPDMGRAAR